MKTWKHCTIFGILAIFVFISCDNEVISTPTYDSVIIIQNKAYIAQGETITFTAIVNGKNNPDQGVIWSVEGGKFGTSIIGGVLTVFNEETDNTVLTIKASSIVNPSVSALSTITVLRYADFCGTWFYDNFNLTIDIDFFKYELDDGFFIMNNIEWEAVDWNWGVLATATVEEDIKNEYPTGFFLLGTITSSSDEDSIGVEIGGFPFINAEKNKLYFHGNFSGIYTKRTN